MRVWWTAGALLLVSCDALKTSQPAAPAANDGGEKPPRGGDDDDVAPADAAPADAGMADAGCDGPCPPEVLANGFAELTAVTVDAQNVYFADWQQGVTGAVYQCPKTGCAGPPIKLGAGFAYGIAVVAGRVIWSGAQGTIWACAVGGCAEKPTPLATNEQDAHGVWSDGARLVWTTPAGLRSCAVDDCKPGTIFATSFAITNVGIDGDMVLWSGEGKTRTCTASACTPRQELDKQALAVAINGPTIYAVLGSTIVDCPLTGCSQVGRVIATSTMPRALTTDGTSIFWRDDHDHGIYRCPAGGCAPLPSLVASDQVAEAQGTLTTDGLYVYWTTKTALLRARK